MHFVARNFSEWLVRLGDLTTRYQRVLLRGWDDAADDARHNVALLSATRRLSITDASEGAGQLEVVDQAAGRGQEWDVVALMPSRHTKVPRRDLLEDVVASYVEPNELLYVGDRAPFIAVVSLHKSGTHILGRLAEKLGFQPFGIGIQVGPPPGPYHDWCEWEEEEFDRLPEGTAYFSHTLPLVYLRKPGERYRRLLLRWAEAKFPLIFNYRDPRAILCSVMRYGMNRIVGDASFHSAWIQILGEVLEAIPDDDRRLTRTIELMTDYMHRQFRDNLWLLRHPEVCKTCYEGLAGPLAGGDADRQRKMVASVMIHLGVSGCPGDIAAELFSRKVRTFSRGRVDGWIEDFHEHHLLEFNAKYGDILAAFGYSQLPLL